MIGRQLDGRWSIGAKLDHVDPRQPPLWVGVLLVELTESGDCTMHALPGQRYPLLLKLALLLACVGPTPGTAEEPQINGQVDRLGPYRLVRVWGTPREMGFAHGYLLADEIVELLDGGGVLPEEDAAEADRALRQLIPLIDLPRATTAEFEGMLAGILAARRTAPQLATFKRNLDLADLILHNAGDLLRAFGCSGFTVWGERAGDAGVITTRNFDFHVPGPRALDLQIILVRTPSEGARVATVTFPGYIGAFTGVNEHGVCAFMHDGTGPMVRRPDKKETPLAIVLKDLLEAATPADAQALAERRFGAIAPYPFSYFVRLVGPRVPGRVDVPVRIFRLDGDGLSENPPSGSMCITTNHYLASDLKPVPEAHEWSTARYDRIAEMLDGTVTPELAWRIQKSVANDSQGGPTLHTLVVYPEQRRLDLAMAFYKAEIIAAPHRAPTTITFAQLFSD